MYPYQVVKTDEEANLREVEDPENTYTKCLFCKFLISSTMKCKRGHNVTDARLQICDEWRYVA